MLVDVVVSTMRSSVGIHEIARWQFCRITQVPRACATSIMDAASGPWYTHQCRNPAGRSCRGSTWPCPSDIDSRRVPNPLSAANFSKLEYGS